MIRIYVAKAFSYAVDFTSYLPKDSKIFDVDEVINLDPSKLKTEETGERIVRKIQEWLISETSAGERAALPEDVTQCLLIGVSKINIQQNPFEFSKMYHLFSNFYQFKIPLHF